MSIDQKNDIEKSEQVTQMRKIYARAKEVVTWLGPSRDNSDLAIDWIQNFGAQAHDLTIGSIPALQLIPLLTDLATERAAAMDDKLKQFLRRLHIELSPSASGHTPVIRCGDSIANEENMHHAQRILRNYMHFNSLHTASEIYDIDIKHTINLFKARRIRGSPPLIYLLRISSDADDLGIAIDYRWSCQEVYTLTARALIDHGVLDVLSLVSQLRCVANLQSWVPDWSCDIAHNILQHRALNRNSNTLEAPLQPAYNACGRLVHTAIGTPTSSWHCPLQLSGVLVATVVDCGEQYQAGQEGRWLADIFHLASRTGSATVVPNEDCLRDAIRVAAADQDVRRGTAKPRLPRATIEAVRSLLIGCDLNLVTSKMLIDADLSTYDMQIKSAAEARRPILLSNDMVGIAPARTLLDDCLFIVSGAAVPHVLRRHSDGKFQLIGESYTHGLMYGELANEKKVEELTVV
ncbi:hypothetical protein KC331_g832 [Hortaea werneckii]|nr:hypothetical protein KC331_g832 [Hortaea werneckii]KAI7721139.1 hypothetical protein KC353_g1603 [Hortaea werneckii]